MEPFIPSNTLDLLLLTQSDRFPRIWNKHRICATTFMKRPEPSSRWIGPCSGDERMHCEKLDLFP